MVRVPTQQGWEKSPHFNKSVNSYDTFEGLVKFYGVAFLGRVTDVTTSLQRAYANVTCLELTGEMLQLRAKISQSRFSPVFVTPVTFAILRHKTIPPVKGGSTLIWCIVLLYHS